MTTENMFRSLQNLVRLVLLLFLLLGCSGCGAMVIESPEDFFELFLNMEPPAGIAGFQGEGAIYGELPPVWPSNGYFVYTLPEEEFARLQQHADFLMESEWNHSFQESECLDDFTYWTEEPIDLKDKRCFEAVFFPVIHYLVYDPATDHVHHFVTGMRD